MHMYYKKHLQVLCVTFGGLRCSYILQKVIARKAKAFDGDPVPESFLQPQLPTNDPITQEATLISKEDIKYKKKLGEGAHGAVFEGTWSNKHGSVSGREGGREGKEGGREGGREGGEGGRGRREGGREQLVLQHNPWA